MVGWVVGALESNAKLNSKLRLKLKLELSLAIMVVYIYIQVRFPISAWGGHMGGDRGPMRKEV